MTAGPCQTGLPRRAFELDRNIYNLQNCRHTRASDLATKADTEKDSSKTEPNDWITELFGIYRQILAMLFSGWLTPKQMMGEEIA